MPLLAAAYETRAQFAARREAVLSRLAAEETAVTTTWNRYRDEEPEPTDEAACIDCDAPIGAGERQCWRCEEDFGGHDHDLDRKTEIENRNDHAA